MEEEEKVDDANMDMYPPHNNYNHHQTQPKMTLFKTLFGDCLCQGAFPSRDNNQSTSSQFINLHGIEFIGLGAVCDELTPKERVYDTLEQLTTRTERLISIGYLSQEKSPSGNLEVLLETVPLDVWNKTYPNDQSMSKRLKRMIQNISVSN